MKKRWFLLYSLTAILFLSSCKNNKQPTTQTNTDTTSFFPVNDYLATDIKDVVQTPYFIYKKTIINNKQTDSIVISKKEFEQLANEFLQRNITAIALKSFYKPALFNDLSTKSITFTYTALKDDLPVRMVSVLLDDETNKLKHVFITAVTTNKDSTITEQLSWKAGKSFRINRFIEKANGSKTEESNFINWNDKFL